MTQPGETDNYDVKEHIDALSRQVGEPFIDFVICSSESIVKMFYNDMKKRIQNQ